MITFPTSPTVGDRFSNPDASLTWVWNGVGWAFADYILKYNMTDVASTALYSYADLSGADTIDLGPHTTVTDVVYREIVSQLMTSGSSDADASSYSTASISPGSDSFLLVFAVSTHATLDAPAITVSGLTNTTWTEVTNVLFGAAGTPLPGRLSCWQGVVAGAAGSGVLTIAATNSTSCKWTVQKIDGHDPSGTVVQSPTVSGAAGTTGTVTLSAAGADRNRPISAFSHIANEATTPRTNWTEYGDVTTTAPVGALESQFRDAAFETTATATWTTSSRYGAIALEIKALAAGA